MDEHDELPQGNEPGAMPELGPVMVRPDTHACFRMLADFREDLARNAESSAWYYESIGNHPEAARYTRVAAAWRKLAARARRRAA